MVAVVVGTEEGGDGCEGGGEGRCRRSEERASQQGEVGGRCLAPRYGHQQPEIFMHLQKEWERGRHRL